MGLALPTLAVDNVDCLLIGFSTQEKAELQARIIEPHPSVGVRL
jgi:hypothetical protein